MNKQQAGAQLAEIAEIAARVKQSRIYRVGGDIIMVWGALQFVRYAYLVAAPRWAGSTWFLVDAIGVVATIAMVRRASGHNLQTLGKALAAFALFYAFGWVWADLIGSFAPRQLATFWPTLFLFGYSLAGLWFGFGFAALGLTVTGLILVGYVFVGEWYPLWLAVVTGGGFLLCGLWMRRA